VSSATMLEPSFTTATLTWRRLWGRQPANAASESGIATSTAERPTKMYVSLRTVMARQRYAAHGASSVRLPWQRRYG
jgi:hypothetical protein